MTRITVPQLKAVALQVSFFLFVILVGCIKQKAPEPKPADDLMMTPPSPEPTSADTDSTIIQRYTDSARLMGYEDSALIKAYIEFKVNQNELNRMKDRLARTKEFEAKKSNDNDVLFGMGFFSVILFLLLLPSLIPAFIASHKGRSGFGIFLLSVFFTPIVGLIVALIISPINKVETNGNN